MFDLFISATPILTNTILALLTGIIAHLEIVPGSCPVIGCLFSSLLFQIRGLAVSISYTILGLARPGTLAGDKAAKQGTSVCV